MGQLNRIIRQDEDIALDNDVGQSAHPPNNKYQDMRAAPRRLNNSTSFAGLVRNKSAPIPELQRKNSQNVTPDIPTEIYQISMKLEIYRSGLIPFKNLMFDASSMVKTEVKDISGFLTVKDYSQKLSLYNERNKYR